MAASTAILVKGYPRLSETFIAQEILGLQQRGQCQLIVSLRHPTDRVVHPLHRQITAPVLYLPEYLHEEPDRVAAARAWARDLPSYGAAYAAFRRDYDRDPTTNRWRRFGQACVLARELPAAVGWLHSHYLHTPASVARYAALLTGLPWSFAAHAKDIWTSPDWELREKLGSARWGVSCTRLNCSHLRALTPPGGAPVDLIYHGLDRGRFPPPGRPSDRDGSRAEAPVRLISVGRAVAKKGFDLLIDALAALPPDRHWRWQHIGGGPLLDRLAARAEAPGLAGRITWTGARDQPAVIEALAAADLFVLPCRIAEDGDRDGVPNVLMEAQIMGLACLSTRVSAIPELIEDGRTGRLVAPDEPDRLGAVLAELIADPTQRRRLALAGRRHVLEAFAFQPGLDRLAAHFGLAAQSPRGNRVSV